MCKNRTLFTKFKKSLVNTRKRLRENVFSLFREVKKIDDSVLVQLEEKLLISDIGVDTTQKIIRRFVDRCASMGIVEVNKDIYYVLCQEMVQMLSSINHPLRVSEDKKPFIILVLGVNGVGKTSMIGKLAYRYYNERKIVLLGAADTFRAAAVEQLKIIGEKIGVSVISDDYAKDPASVVFKSIRYAQAKCFDILMIDTAGRLQNKIHLMEELKKIVRVIKKFDISAPHEIMIVLDATIGQNSFSQVSLFNECVGLTGISMSKLDGTSKGGVLFSIVDQFNIPIRYVSFGKKSSDLEVFDVNYFVKSIFG